MTDLPIPQGKTPTSFGELSSEAQSRVRAWLSGRVKVFLAHFPLYHPDDERVEGSMIADWVEVLKDYRTAEVDEAMIAYLRSPERSSTGRAIRPGPWVIRDAILKTRPRPKLVAPEVSKEELRARGLLLTKEERELRRIRAAAILREVGAAKKVGS